MNKVNVIIPTFNRYKYLLNTIESIKMQTYKNIEIIVINDGSTQKEYYEYDWSNNNITIIHLKNNTKKAGYVRNQGIKICDGKYIAFCDDDDIWLPKKIELQIEEMKKYNCKMCSSDGYIGNGIYNEKNKYRKYNDNIFYKKIKNSNLLSNGIPKIWNEDFLNIHNFIITSSVIVEKEIIDKTTKFTEGRMGREDADCWKKLIKYTNSVYLEEPLFYYDNKHGDGRQY